MAILMILEVPGGTTDQYDKVNELLGMQGNDNAPDGLVSHTCAVTDDGILIADVWESQEALDRFFHDRLGAALAGSGMPQSQPRVLSVHHTISGSA